MAVEWTLDSFRLAGHAHVHVARSMLSVSSAKGVQIPALTPGSAAYLAHVALECALKARILYRGGCASTEDLKAKQPKVHDALFKGPRGHDLNHLAQQVRLVSFVKAEGKAWADDECWRRMCAEARPYTLRYGAERITRNTADEDVTRAEKLIALLLSGITSVPHKRRRRGSR